MSRLLFDTNILLDIAIPGRPEKEEAREVMRLCNGEGDIGFVCPLSLKDAYYVLAKGYDEKTARRWVDQLMGLLVIAPVSAEECDMSLRGNEPDFEDGLIRAVAELEDIDYIITRDKRAFANSPVKSVTAAEYLSIPRKSAFMPWQG